PQASRGGQATRPTESDGPRFVARATRGSRGRARKRAASDRIRSVRGGARVGAIGTVEPTPQLDRSGARASASRRQATVGRTARRAAEGLAQQRASTSKRGQGSEATARGNRERRRGVGLDVSDAA